MIISFSKHAKERINDRGLAQKTITEVVNNADAVLQEQESIYLYRVFVNICKQPPLVITAYKTSKIDKYEY